MTAEVCFGKGTALKERRYSRITRMNRSPVLRAIKTIQLRLSALRQSPPKD
jgi:hypothetical protein